MPVIVNIAANLIFGAALVLAVKRSAALRESFVSWVLFFLVGFQALLATPTTTFLFRFYPQWSMLYLFDPQIFPDLDRWIGWLSLCAVLLNFGASLLGYTLARLGVTTGQAWLWATPLVIGVATLSYIAFAFWDRVLFIGDYDAFWQGNAHVLVATLAGWLGILLYGLAIAFVVWTRHRFADHDPSFI